MYEEVEADFVFGFGFVNPAGTNGGECDSPLLFHCIRPNSLIHQKFIFYAKYNSSGFGAYRALF